MTTAEPRDGRPRTENRQKRQGPLARPLVLSSGKAVARLTGLEPATPGVTGRYSNQLSYNRTLTFPGISPAGVRGGLRRPQAPVKGVAQKIGGSMADS